MSVYLCEVNRKRCTLLIQVVKVFRQVEFGYKTVLLIQHRLMVLTQPFNYIAHVPRRLTEP